MLRVHFVAARQLSAATAQWGATLRDRVVITSVQHSTVLRPPPSLKNHRQAWSSPNEAPEWNKGELFNPASGFKSSQEFGHHIWEWLLWNCITLFSVSFFFSHHNKKFGGLGCGGLWGRMSPRTRLQCVCLNSAQLNHKTVSEINATLMKSSGGRTGIKTHPDDPPTAVRAQNRWIRLKYSDRSDINHTLRSGTSVSNTSC